MHLYYVLLLLSYVEQSNKTIRRQLIKSYIRPMEFLYNAEKMHDRSIRSYSLLHFEIRLDFMECPYYPRKLVLANARSGKTVPTRGSRAGPTTHPHSRIKHKCHLPMPDPHEPRASLLLPLLLLFLLSETPRAFFPPLPPPFFLLPFRDPVVADFFTCLCCNIR